MSLPKALRADLERALRTGAYASVAVAGFASIYWTPNTISAVLGTITAMIWGLLLLVGGITCAAASLTERYLIEYPAILLVVAGAAMYLVALWAITAGGEITRLTQTALVTAYALHLLARHVQLRRLAGVPLENGD
ncbi:hypothetical protein DW322_21285 [Rhodococcus rhodnii]|uniref:Integral membrane protein n=2 Tax=Rhodococcus rhodnii TaxID=38312 RepID=R7WPS1_9NOCA|nr:hypothetical protein [Rhodococcus rhodnii]EOM77302.1 hypothetical protein Rrhod_1336 [Rhodococcus rhodnii LMG 5362]TXG88283.1 hypothetical protein DW322_21615 [Rhodococcus rhodnii]TXG88314.1 hypothetical protein DW322_21365 [Rhodococcus rhodnii]TXG89079.1 hypothetical protein DW322_00990 [Rhodococcus rhodnii]TXG92234.1 hypothetical protein DW322_21285 [Rhodococcus rhodnii]